MSETERKFRFHINKRVVAIVGSSFLALSGIACITASVLFWSLLGRVSFSGDQAIINNDYNSMDDIQPDEDDGIPQGVVVDPAEYENASSVLELPLRGNENGIRNILLVGVDSRYDNFSGLSDTTIILSINDNTKTIKMISILRDTWVSVPGRDKDGDGQDDICKFNAAYAYGRHTLQHKTIAQNFRLDVDDYIGVNFKGLPVLIDAMGGLDIKLTAAEMTQIPALGCKISVRNPGFVPMTGEPGVHHLDGFQAMEYARIRKIDSDFKRTERQRKVLTLLFEKAKTMNVTQLVSFVYEAVKHVDTNMSADEFLSFATDALKYASYTVENDYRIPEDGMYKYTTIEGKGSGILLTDPKKTVSDLHKYIYG